MDGKEGGVLSGWGGGWKIYITPTFTLLPSSLTYLRGNGSHIYLGVLFIFLLSVCLSLLRACVYR